MYITLYHLHVYTIDTWTLFDEHVKCASNIYNIVDIKYWYRPDNITNILVSLYVTPTEVQKI